jgi:DNA-binding transcriptional regulator YiaG
MVIYSLYSPTMMTGLALKHIRKRLALTQQAFAKKIGVTSNTVARWERDEVGIAEPIARLIRMLSTQKGR